MKGRVKWGIGHVKILLKTKPEKDKGRNHWKEDNM